MEGEMTTTNEVLVTLQLRFAGDNRVELANQLSPLIHEALVSGGRLLSVSVQNVEAEPDP